MHYIVFEYLKRIGILLFGSYILFSNFSLITKNIGALIVILAIAMIAHYTVYIKNAEFENREKNE